MAQDWLGNPITATDPATRAAIDDFVLGLLNYDVRLLNILPAAEAADDCLANAYAGLLWMMSETGGIPEQARSCLARAERYRDGANARERRIAGVLRRWVDGELDASIALIDQALAAHPRDLAMLKLHQYHDFNRGDFAGMLRAALGSREAASDVGFLHGMLAFGYEQCHLLEDAERTARTALELRPDDQWAQHALAHVMLTQGRIDEGAAFLESMRGRWETLTSFMYTHHWWHLALFYLSQGREAEALAAYDDHCWSRERDLSQDQIGAVSLLARFDFAGLEVGRRWDEVGDRLRARASDVTNPFLSLQYLYGLARAGRAAEADRLLSAIGAEADRAGAEPVWRDVALPVARGLAAHAAGDPETALGLLEAPLGRLAEIGGSHAQRDLFEQVLLDCLLRTGRLGRAQQVLEQRRGYDPDGAPLNRLLAGVYDGLGLPTLGDRARARVDRRLARTAALGTPSG